MITLTIILAACVLLIAACSLLLKKSLCKTIYSYLNVELIGILIYLCALFCVLSVRLIFCVLGTQTSGEDILSLLMSFRQDFALTLASVILALCVSVAISNIALIRHEGLHLRNTLGVLLGVFYVGGSAAALILCEVIEKYMIDSGSAKFAGLFLQAFIMLVLCYFECVLAGSVIMGWKAAHDKPKYDRDYIIILGCSIDKKGGLLPLLKGRVNRAIRFAWDQERASGTKLRYVPSGGQGKNEVMSEGSAMELYLKTRGAEDDEVYPEKKSATTYENMVFSKKIIDAQKKDAKIAFATTNYHMLRSGILARKAGIDAQGIAGDTKWYFWPNGFVREFFALLLLEKKAHIIAVAIIIVLSAASALFGIFAL